MNKLPLQKTSISTGFDSVFTEVEGKRPLNLKNKNCLRLFCLDIANNAFIFTALHQFLQKNIGRYVFSRATLENFRIEGDEEAIGLRAIELLRSASNSNDKGAGGELGEILLYIFLEQKLNAPKLLSKVELKTSGNQYIFGSDGVHLLCVDDTEVPFYQLILGESKIKGNLKDAVDDAFESIGKVSTEHDNELRLIDKNILAESFDEKTADFIKSLVVPSKRDHSLNVDNAFGIFLGYSLGLDAASCSNTEYRDVVVQKMKSDIQDIAPYIEKKINSTNLFGYSFYFFLVPFNKAADDRAAIIKKLKGGE
jgi:hypothetical protein